MTKQNKCANCSESRPYLWTWKARGESQLRCVWCKIWHEYRILPSGCAVDHVQSSEAQGYFNSLGPIHTNGKKGYLNV